jgi:hypothetical protein
VSMAPSSLRFFSENDRGERAETIAHVVILYVCCDRNPPPSFYNT